MTQMTFLREGKANKMCLIQLEPLILSISHFFSYDIWKSNWVCEGGGT